MLRGRAPNASLASGPEMHRELNPGALAGASGARIVADGMPGVSDYILCFSAEKDNCQRVCFEKVDATIASTSERNEFWSARYGQEERIAGGRLWSGDDQ